MDVFHINEQCHIAPSIIPRTPPWERKSRQKSKIRYWGAKAKAVNTTLTRLPYFLAVSIPAHFTCLLINRLISTAHSHLHLIHHQAVIHQAVIHQESSITSNHLSSNHPSSNHPPSNHLKQSSIKQSSIKQSSQAITHQAINHQAVIHQALIYQALIYQAVIHHIHNHPLSVYQ